MGESFWLFVRLNYLTVSDWKWFNIVVLCSVCTLNLGSNHTTLLLLRERCHEQTYCIGVRQRRVFIEKECKKSGSDGMGKTINRRKCHQLGHCYAITNCCALHFKIICCDSNINIHKYLKSRYLQTNIFKFHNRIPIKHWQI